MQVLFAIAEPGTFVPLLILIAEMVVVTLATVRTIFIARGMKILAPMLGFFEVTIWLFAIGEVMKNLCDWRCSLAFAAGFTAGNFLGILVEQALALGNVLVRSVTPRDVTLLVRELRTGGYGVTCVNGVGASGPVQVVLSVVPRRELGAFKSILERFDPEMFYCVDGLASSFAGVTPSNRRGLSGLVPALPEIQRKIAASTLWRTRGVAEA